MAKTLLKIIKFYIVLYLSISWLVDQGLMASEQLTILQIIPLLLFLIIVYKKKGNVNLRPYSISIAFPLIVVASTVINNVSALTTILNIRWLVLPYFTFLVIQNLNLSEKDLKKLIKFVFIVAIIHIPLAFIKYFILQWHGETTLGLISHSGSTYFVAMAFAFILAYQKTNKKLINILLIIGFLMVAVSSGKRALAFLIPAVFIIYIYLNRSNIKRFIPTFITALIVSSLIFYVLVRMSPTLNPNRKVWGRFDIKYTFEYFFDYTTAERVSYKGTTVDRLATTIYLVNEIISTPKNIMLGLGGDKLSKSNTNLDTIEDLLGDVEYGINGLTWLAYQFGLISAIIWFIFFFKYKNIANKIKKRTNDIYWSNYANGLYITAIIMSIFQFFYSAEYKNPAFISLVYILLVVADKYYKLRVNKT